MAEFKFTKPNPYRENEVRLREESPSEQYKGEHQVVEQERHPGLQITISPEGTHTQVHPDIILGLFSLLTGISSNQEPPPRRVYRIRKLRPLTGGDILHVLQGHPRGLTIKQIARRLRVPYNRLIVPLSQFVREGKLLKLSRARKGMLYFWQAQ